jgi:YVTN family beta-propeller protein
MTHVLMSPPNDAISIIDLTMNTIIGNILLMSPLDVSIAPDGTRAYVTTLQGQGQGPHTVAVIDTVANAVIASVTVGAGPLGVAITPDSKRAYVTNQGSDTVSVIDTPTNSVIATVPVGSCPLGIAIMRARQAPTNKSECKNGGYKNFGPPVGPFKNQGQCIKHVIDSP